MKRRKAPSCGELRKVSLATIRSSAACTSDSLGPSAASVGIVIALDFRKAPARDFSLLSRWRSTASGELEPKKALATPSRVTRHSPCSAAVRDLAVSSNTTGDFNCTCGGATRNNVNGTTGPLALARSRVMLWNNAQATPRIRLLGRKICPRRDGPGSNGMNRSFAGPAQTKVVRFVARPIGAVGAPHPPLTFLAHWPAPATHRTARHPIVGPPFLWLKHPTP